MWEVDDVPGPRQLVGDVLGCLQLPQLHQTLTRLAKGCGQQLGRLGVTLGRDDGRLLLLLRLIQGNKHSQNMLIKPFILIVVNFLY